MELYHTSPAEIIEITSASRFGGFLFFSADEYVQTTGEYITYMLDLDDDDIIDAEQLFYHPDAGKLEPLVTVVCDLVGCDEEIAEELISQRKDVHNIDTEIDPEDLADISWDIQAITGRAAVLLGYRGAAMSDEQGRAYLIDMAGRENNLTKK